MKCGDYDALIELATICSLCNDSSVDFNEVQTASDILHSSFHTSFYYHCICNAHLLIIIVSYIIVVCCLFYKYLFANTV